jgi:glucosamine-6-phosphate deaminase
MPRPAVTVLDDYEALSRAAADVVAGVVEQVPTARVVTATGDTPMGLYRELADRRARGAFDPSGITVFLLDEYLGVGPDDRRSLAGWAMRSFVDPLGIAHERFVPLPADGDAGACIAYDREVAAGGGYDLCILGIGPNGHIGFNEPPCDASAPTRAVDLTPETVGTNAAYWGGPEHVPRRAVTIGLAGLLDARTTLLVASGSRKRGIVRRAVLGSVTPEVPASHLQTVADLRVLVDRDAWEDPGA